MNGMFDNDTLLGGTGDDLLRDGSPQDKDRLFGGPGRDTLDARDGDGNHLVNGGAGSDDCSGDRNDRFVNCSESSAFDYRSQRWQARLAEPVVTPVLPAAGETAHPDISARAVATSNGAGSYLCLRSRQPADQAEPDGQHGRAPVSEGHRRAERMSRAGARGSAASTRRDRETLVSSADVLPGGLGRLR